MYFKPKIFISSTFKLLDLRNEIKKYFESAGAEVILYEKDLTPSITPATYRQDIKEADFIIFIFDENYGTKTESGKSGTHEEWDITKDTDIPKHIYLKKPSEELDKDQKAFIENEIKNNMSYYYYKNDNDLLNQINKMTFTVARDIAVYKIYDLKMDDVIIKRLALDHDYRLALEFIKEMDLLKNLHYKGMADLLRTLILFERIDGWFEYFYKLNNDIFIDKKLNQYFLDISNKYNDYIERLKNLSKPLERDKIVFYPERNFVYTTTPITIIDSIVNEPDLRELLDKYLKSFNKFEKYVFDQKNSFDKSNHKYWV
jgi:hypothetical protein